MAAITHIIFDMDGLLLDTEEFCAFAQRRILERYGKPFDWSVRAKMLGKTAPEAARVFLDETGLGGVLTPEQFLRDREEMLRQLFPTADLMPGVKRLVSHLHANGIPICVATGSHREHFDLKTQRHGELFSLMHHVVTGDDPEVKVGKPCPDIFLTASHGEVPGFDICGNPENDPPQQIEQQHPEEEGEPQGPHFCELCCRFVDD